MLLRANIGSIDLANDNDIGPFSLSELDHASEESGIGILASLPGVGDSAGASNLGDGSNGAVGQIPTALYDPNNLPLTAEGLPQLESLPGASIAIYLDFDGHGSNTPFDVDGDSTTFNATEQGRIWETWRQVGAFYSAFDANVTTITPDFANVPTNYELISNSISGGYSYLQFPTDFPRGFNQSGDAPNRASGIIHEIGHNFGLHHQSDFGTDGTETRDYSFGDNNLEVPTLGVDFGGRIHRLYIGHTGNASALQDDVNHVQSRILEHTTNGGDGFRGDDHGADAASATTLTVDGALLRGSGVIERRTDVDSFSFTASPATSYSILVTPERSSPVDVLMELYDSNGDLIASSDQREHFEQVFFHAPASETYTLQVASHGDYGEIGSYEIVVQPQADFFKYSDLIDTHNYKNGQLQNRRGQAIFDPATDIYEIRASAGDIWGTQDDMTFAHRTLVGDGSITARVDTNSATHAWSKLGVMIRESAARNSKHAFMSVTGNNGFAFQYRTDTGGSSGNSNTGTGNELGSYVRLTRSGDTITGEHSPDGVNWTTQDTRTISMADEVQIGLAFTNRSTGTAHLATFSDLTVTGAVDQPAASALAAPSGLAIAAGAQGALTASWSPVVGAIGYAVATSLDNFSWTEVAQVDDVTFDHTLTGLDGDRRHFARIAAIDSSGDWSEWSNVSFADTRPGAVTNLQVKTFSSTELVLDWREANGEIGYRIERSTDGTVWTNVGEVGAQVPSFTDSGLSSETSYQYRVITLDDLGDAATSTTVSRETRFNALSDLQSVESAQQEVTLTWTDSNANETGYLVERKHEVGNWQTIGTTAADAEQFVDSDIPWYGRFEYRVSPQHPTILPSSSTTEHWVYGASTLFRFDDSGDTLVDDGTTISSQPINGTNTTRVPGKSGDGLLFNGIDSGVNLAQSSSIHGTIDFTIGAWIKTSGTSDAFIVGQRDGQWQGWQTYYRFRMLANGRLRFQINNRHEGGNQFNLQTSTTVNDGQWHYVVAQREGAVGRIYIDGVEAASGSGSVKWLNGDIATAIGYNLRDNNNYFDGVIDDLRIIDQALTPTQMSAIMNNQGPTVTQVQVNGGNVQRSGIQTVRVDFDQSVDIDLDAGDAFRFVNADTAEVVDDVPTVSEVDGKTVVDFTFMPGASVNAAGGLMDGNYQLNIDADMIDWFIIPLDGDGDGTAGDDHQFGETPIDNFYRKYGDQNGNRTVDLLDFGAFRGTFGKTSGDTEFLGEFDDDGDNTIGLLDFANFRRNFGS